MATGTNAIATLQDLYDKFSMGLTGNNKCITKEEAINNGAYSGKLTSYENDQLVKYSDLEQVYGSQTYINIIMFFMKNELYNYYISDMRGIVEIEISTSVITQYFKDNLSDKELTGSNYSSTSIYEYNDLCEYYNGWEYHTSNEYTNIHALGRTQNIYVPYNFSYQNSGLADVGFYPTIKWLSGDKKANVTVRLDYIQYCINNTWYQMLSGNYPCVVSVLDESGVEIYSSEMPGVGSEQGITFSISDASKIKTICIFESSILKSYLTPNVSS